MVLWLLLSINTPHDEQEGRKCKTTNHAALVLGVSSGSIPRVGMLHLRDLWGWQATHEMPMQ